MDITVALDGSKRRDLQLFQGDTATINVIVYEHDGDTEPITPSGVRFVDTDGFAYGEPFAVSEDRVGRSWYRIVGEVDGVTTTLAFGYVTVEGGYAGWYGGYPDGYWVSP